MSSIFRNTNKNEAVVTLTAKEIFDLEQERTLIQEEYDSKIKLLDKRREAIDKKYKFVKYNLVKHNQVNRKIHIDHYGVVKYN